MSQMNGSKSDTSDIEDIELDVNWEDVTCPICLDFPHNGVLLQCSSYEKGCRPFICDTDHTHSNCLNRFRSAYGMRALAKFALATDGSTGESIQVIPSSPDSLPTCPLCRGVVTGWVINDDARLHLNLKRRCCEERHCLYAGNFLELQLHAKLKHPHSRPSEIDPAHKLDWENFQQSSDIVDVLTTIHAEVPHAVVMGDYVIEYGDDGVGDEYEEFPPARGKWWTSCIFYQVFDKFRASRNRRRSRARERRRERRRSTSGASNQDDGSLASADSAEYRFDERDDQFARTGATESREIYNSYRSFYD